MMQLHVEAEATARTEPAVVWSLVADADSYARWGPWSAGGYERPGDRSTHGVGAVRWFRYGRTTSVERVLEVDEGRRLAYTVIRGLPVRNYRAEVTLTPTADGTCVHWAATWDKTLVGRIVQRKLRAVYGDVVTLLVAAAEAGTAPSSPGSIDEDQRSAPGPGRP